MLKRLLILVAIAALIAAACGDDDDTTTAADDGSASEDASADEGGGDESDVVVRGEGESYDDYIARLYEAAKEEGRVIYYQSAGESELEFINEQWEAMFPEVSLEPVTARAGTILERALVEFNTGNVAGDVFGASGVDMLLLAEEGALEDYAPAGLENVQEEFRFDGPYVGLNYLSRHPTYNTENVDPSELPDDWWGYCEPEWNGRIGIDAESFEWAAVFIEAWGEEEAREFLQCIADNDPVLHRGTTAGTELVNVGEFDVKLDGMGHVSKRFVDGGANIGVQVPSPDPMPAIIDTAGILAGAPNPNAARLLQEFWLMPEGELAMTNEGKATTTSTEETHPYWEFMTGANIVLLGPEQSDVLNQGLEMFTEIFGSGA